MQGRQLLYFKELYLKITLNGLLLLKKAYGKVQICADYSTDLVNSLDAHQYSLPVLEDLFIKLNGRIFFAKIDLSGAFLLLEVEEESKEHLFSVFS